MHRGIKVINSAGAIKSVGATGATGNTGATGSNGTNGTNGADLAHPWAGKIAGAYADGDPNFMLGAMNRVIGSASDASPTNISTSVARCSYFMLPFDLTVNKLRYFSIAAINNTYSVAIYRLSDLARLTTQLDFNTAGTKVWGAVGSSLGLSLTKNTPYFLACSVRATGSAGVTCFTGSGNSASPCSAVLPTAQPGNLVPSNGYAGTAAFGQFAVTTGALPTTAATLAVQPGWTGGMPAFFLDNDNS
jgi:hypothetical protein